MSVQQIYPAAKVAGDWWADRLSSNHANKRDAFSALIAKKISEQFDGGKAVVWTEVDYDPQGLMLEAVREVIDDKCDGYMFSADGILPRKHELCVYRDKLVPKEGYGNFTDIILVKNEESAK